MQVSAAGWLRDRPAWQRHCRTKAPGAAKNLKNSIHTMEAVDDFLKYLAADRGYSPETIRSYRTGLEGFYRFFHTLDDGLNWQDIDADIVRRWMAERIQEGTQPQTVRRALSALRAFYRYQLLMGRMTCDPMQKVQNPKVPHRLPVFLKASEMDRLLDDVVFPDTLRGQRDHLILLTFYTTGIRVSELVGLDVEDVHPASGELKVTGKRNKQRIVPFGAELAKAFLHFAAVRRANGLPESGAVFTCVNGRRLSATEVRHVVRGYLSLVTSQRKKSPHVLRHTFATVMLNNGADLEAVRELLGHESLSTTEIYTHTSFSDLKKAYEAAHPREASACEKCKDQPS